MTAQETAWQAAESAAAALAPDADVLASVDSAGLGASTFAVLRRAATKPTAATAAALRYWTSVAMAGPTAAARWMGLDAPPVSNARFSAAGRARSTPGRSGSAITSPRPPARSCSRTT